MKTIKFQNNEFQFNDVHIAKAGDKAWDYAWGIADEFGYLAPCVIESLPDQDDNEQILAVDREDKCKAECVAIICSKEKSPMFPSLTDDARCIGFQFVYEGDQFEVLYEHKHYFHGFSKDFGIITIAKKKLDRYRKATEAEKQIGHHIDCEVLDKPENHISPNCKVEDV